MSDKYAKIHQHSLTDPEGFWAGVASEVAWITPPTRILDQQNSPFNQWFADGEINACFNAIDRHINDGRGAQVAIYYDSPVTDTREQISFSELQTRTALFAGVLAARGISKGDRVLIYMPMIPDAIVATLACARLGAIHTVVFGGFAANELAVRIDDCTPDVIVSASCGIEISRIIEYKPLLDEAIRLASHKPACCIIRQRTQCEAPLIEGRDVDWAAEESTAEPHDCVAVKSTDPLYILYTSGTTGQPKGVVRDTGGSVVSLRWTMKNIYDVDPGDVYWAASDIGWVVGHSYIIYGPLFNGNSTVLYEGKPVGTPDAGAFWRVIAEYGVKVLFTAPTAFRAIRKEDPAGQLLKQYDLSKFESLFLAGERCDPDTLHWAEEQLQVPVIDHWWQTETGWSICATCKGIEMSEIIPGSPGLPAPGYEVKVLNDQQQPVGAGDIGALVVKLPLPPGTFINLWNAPERFKSAYFENYPGYYETGDAGYIDDSGHVFVMARTDDVINVAGHRLSTGAMEEVLTSHPDVAECAVMGVADDLKGQLPVGFLVINSGTSRENTQIVQEVIGLVREKIGPVAAFKTAVVVPRLPKTRSGKILRATMRSIADNEEWKMPATIDDPAILDEIEQALKTVGYAGGN
ncbi:MAG: propionyl-CoA synthetase [Granulosicoccus sp.]|nr:propionyl-CoA synthetase [Granulosicoccus sp.]